jgi:uncharacterized membrane protein YfcA
MGVHRAVATSLLIIALIGLSGAATSVWQGRLDWALLAPFAGGGALAMVATRAFAARIAGPTLQQAFAAIVVLVGVGMGAAVLF